MHIQNANSIAELKQYSCYKIKGFVKEKPHIIEGGHMFFTLSDESGEIECGAYEPTKNFRKVVAKLRAGDEIELYGGIGEQNTFNIEKFQVIKLNEFIYRNPICECGKRMTSAGKIERTLINGKFYETPVSARRHLSKPLIRMNLE